MAKRTVSPSVLFERTERIAEAVRFFARARAGHGVNMAATNHADQRATFYFAESQLLALEVLMLRLRTQHKCRAGKSDIMRLALDRLLASDLVDLAGALRGASE